MQYVSPKLSARSPATSSATGKAGESAIVAAVQQDTSTKSSKWVVFVPMDGRPQLTDCKDDAAVQERVDAIVKEQRGGWIYVFEGVRHAVTFSNARTLKIRGQERLLGGETVEADDVIPGTELYPEKREQ